MKTALLLIALVAWVPNAFASFPTRVLHRPSLENVPGGVDTATESLSQLMDDTMAYDLDQLEVTKSTVSDSQCGDAYFVDVVVHGFWHEVQAHVDFYVQTLTQQSQDRLYNAIKMNYASKGLPSCLLSDQFYPDYLTSYSYQYDPDVTTVLVPVSFKPVPQGFPCAGKIERPLTSCWNVENPYGN